MTAMTISLYLKCARCPSFSTGLRNILRDERMERKIACFVTITGMREITSHFGWVTS